MSHYGDYMEELIGRGIVENESGFATYEFVDGYLGCYITDIYVIPEKRKSDIGFKFVEEINEIAKEKECKYRFKVNE